MSTKKLGIGKLGIGKLGVGNWELGVTDAIAGMVPWLAPIPSAVLVANATLKHLGWSEPVAIVAGLIIEGLGLTATSTALMLWDWNARRPAGEPPAPFWVSALLVATYLFCTIGLTVVLDLDTSLAHYAPAIFPLLALVGTINIALRSQHRQRLARITEKEMREHEAAEMEKAERKAEAERRRIERKAEREAKRQTSVPVTSITESIDGLVDRLQAGRAAKKASIIDAMIDAYRRNPHMGDTELGGMVGVTRQTIYNYKHELERAGRVHINGNGVEVQH